MTATNASVSTSIACSDTQSLSLLGITSNTNIVANESLKPVNHQKRYKLLIYGYVRDFEKAQHLDIHQPIKDIIHEYCKILIGWDTNPSHFGRGCEFPQDFQIEFSKLCESIAIADYVISASNFTYFEWEITTNVVGTFSYIGFVQAPVSSSVFSFNKWLGASSVAKQYSLRIGSTLQCIPRRGQNTEKAFAIPVGSEVDGQHCNVYRFSVDFDLQKVAVFRNGCLIDKETFYDIGFKIIPAVSCTEGPALFTIHTITPPV